MSVCFTGQNGGGGGGGPQVHQQQEAADPWVCALTDSAEGFTELERANEGRRGKQTEWEGVWRVHECKGREATH